MILSLVSHRTWLDPQVLESHQVEARGGEGEHRLHLPFSPVSEFAQAADGIHPAEGLLHDLAPTQARPVAFPAGGPVVL